MIDIEKARHAIAVADRLIQLEALRASLLVVADALNAVAEKPGSAARDA